MKIHKEGYVTIIIAFAFLIIINLLSYLLIPYLIIKVISYLYPIIFLFNSSFFRNPERNVLVNNKHIIAPSDGKLVVNEVVFEMNF